MNASIASIPADQTVQSDTSKVDRSQRAPWARWKTALLLLAISFAALFVHGYHPNAEDAEIYLPGVQKALHPELFPSNQNFFASHASLTIFPWIVAGTVKLSHLSLYAVLLGWHFASISLFLSACWLLSGLCTQNGPARWTAVGLVASLLTLPVAGTALYLMDQYVNPRNLSAFIGIAAIALLLKKRYVLAGTLLLLGLAIHPFMMFFAFAYCIVLETIRSGWLRPLGLASFLPLSGLFPPSSPAYHEVALTHSYHYLLSWHWYEWLGVLAPLVIFGWFRRFAHDRGRPMMEAMCRAAIVVGVLSVIAGVVLSASPRFETLARIQPLRSYHLLYVLLSIFSGVVLGECLLKARAWRWFLVFLPACLGMFLAQRALFPHSSHIEWPWAESRNPWVQAFEWSRENTPVTAMFALDPYYMRVRGEDVNGFRAIAQRSMLADAVKDSGAVSMFPLLAEEWHRQVTARKEWNQFRMSDYRRLHEQFGVDWVVLQQPVLQELECPYQNSTVAVCRVNFNRFAIKLHQGI